MTEEAPRTQAANMVARSELMLLLSQEIEKRDWTQQQAATHFGVTQPRISDLVNGRLEKFTVDMLMNWLEMLGKDVSVAVRPNIFSSPEKIKLTLFVVGTENDKVLAEVRRLFGEDESKYELAVVNVLESPEVARSERISATPCLVKTFPLPKVVLVGDLTPTSVRWQLANAESIEAQNRRDAADLREAKLDERERQAKKGARTADRD
jgi:predicted XRE-type DNA-binding protein